MKGKGVSKENAEKAQLKAKAREPGKIFSAFLLFPFFLISFPTYFLFYFRVFPLPDFFLYPFPCDLYSYHISSHLISPFHSLGARAKKAEAAAASSGGLESGESKVELIKRPRDYAVTFSFPEVTHSVFSSPLSLLLYSCLFFSSLLSLLLYSCLFFSTLVSSSLLLSLLHFISLLFIYHHFYFLLYPSLLIVPLLFLSLPIHFLLSSILLYTHLLFSPLLLLSLCHPIWHIPYDNRWA